MAVRPLVILPDRQLRLVSEPVGPITEEVRKLASDMLDTMYDAPGSGWQRSRSACRSGSSSSTSARIPDERSPMVLVDPEITWTSEEKRVHEEGCLSIPEYYEEVERPDRIRLTYRALAGEAVETEADGIWPPASSTRSTT
jgi:peptide deformylase